MVIAAGAFDEKKIETHPDMPIISLNRPKEFYGKR